VAVELSYCVTSTDRRQLLRYCLDAIARERAAVPFETEVLVLDNASHDGSARAARDHPAAPQLISVAERRAASENHADLVRSASGRFCLLLDEDTELEPGATAVLHAALADEERAAAAGAMLVHADGRARPSAWRFPGVLAALLGVAGLHRRLVVQSHGDRVRAVDWCSPTALLVRREPAAREGWFDPALVDSADGADLGRRMRGGGWRVLFVPEARAVRHEPPQSAEEERRRIVEHARNRDRYMRKHHSAAAAAAVRWLSAVRFGTRGLAGLARRRTDASAELLRASAALRPGRD
jgi:N-acetylglucosaminyl-diphospho-decaprenol L-rhamnosyltransferase